MRAAVAICALMLAACGSGIAGAPSAGGANSSSEAVPASIPSGDWTEFDYNPQRSGAGPSRTGITAHDLGRLRRQTIHLDGTVDASPIELHAVDVRGARRDVFIVTTTYGRTIAIDASNGHRLWEYVPGDIGRYEGTAQITNATPLADPDRRYVYAATPDGLIHKLSVGTGHEVRSGHWPARVTFDATREKIGTPLNVSGGNVIAATGGYDGDAPVYQGHVAVIARGSGRVVHAWNSLCSNRHHLINPPRSCPVSDSAIWARAGAVIEPGSRRILLATGNGPFNGVTNWGDSVLELTPDASRLLHNFTPRNQAQLDSNDTDLGSTAPALLPRYRGLRLAVQGSKEGNLRLLNLNRLNGTAGGPGRRLGGELQTISSPGGDLVFTAPAVWSDRGRPYVFVATGSGTAAYRLGPGAARLHVAWHNGTAGTSPILAGGLLYVFDPSGGRLEIYQPTNGRLLGSLPADSGHWNSPIAVGGRIALPVGNANDHATSGVMYIWHLPGR